VTLWQLQYSAVQRYMQGAGSCMLCNCGRGCCGVREAGRGRCNVGLADSVALGSMCMLVLGCCCSCMQPLVTVCGVLYLTATSLHEVACHVVCCATW
jgi:hypothetical protein